MNNTHFVNVTGLHHSNHYSTLHDLSKLVSYAIKNELWYKVTTTKSHKTKPLASHPDGLLLESTFYRYINNTVKKSQYDVTIPGFLGGKSGFTDEARYNLASFARYPGGTYVLLTAKAGNSYYRPSHVLMLKKYIVIIFKTFIKNYLLEKNKL